MKLLRIVLLANFVIVTIGLAITLSLHGLVDIALATVVWTVGVALWGYGEGKTAMMPKKSSAVTTVIPDGQPSPPVDARAIMRDGREIPLELVYVGVDASGCHLWENANPLPEFPVQTRIAIMPARTSIQIRAQR